MRGIFALFAIAIAVIAINGYGEIPTNAPMDSYTEMVCSGPFCSGFYNIPQGDVWTLFAGMFVLLIFNSYLLSKKKKMRVDDIIIIMGVLFLPIILSLPFLFGWALYGNWLSAAIFNPCPMFDVELAFAVFLSLWKERKN